MAIGVKIDFENIYELESISDDLRIATFQSPLKDGTISSLTVKINSQEHAVLPNVYNLAFGPLNAKAQIDDKAELAHVDYSKVFSTILLSSLNYLTVNTKHYLGIDGSDNYRAYYYWRFLQRNFDYLNHSFSMYGVKYYVRITRYGKNQYDNPFDFDDIQPFPERIVKTNDWPEHMYNYYIFKLK
ncbi:MAG: hypothetical protein QM781_12585 [Chitinophagaceae bacterium]